MKLFSASCVETLPGCSGCVSFSGRISETWKFRKVLLSTMHAHGAKLGTALQRRHGFAGIEQPMLIKCGLDGMKSLELSGVELHAHLVDLFESHPMLAGDGAAHFYAELQDGCAVRFCALVLVAFVGIEHDQRMQVAVPRMEHIRALQIKLFRKLVYALQHVRQMFLRNRPIHAVVIRQDASHGG